jgi:Tfp pilus assembly protein PilW
LIEAMVVGVIISVLMGGLIQLAFSMNKANQVVTGMPSVQDDAVRIVNVIAADVKNAVLCSGGSGLADSAVHEAGSSKIGVYRAVDGKRYTFQFTDGKVVRLVDNGTTPDWSVSGVTGFSLKYGTSSTYNVATLPASWATSVTGDTRKQIAAVEITATVMRGGLTGTYTTIVRLRNSPKRA